MEGPASPPPAPTPSSIPQESARPSLVVHHLENARSQRILWLLEELQVPYKIKKYTRTPQRFAPPELFDVHPLGKSPVITDGNVTIAESGAIVEYLIAKYGDDKVKVKPDDPRWVDNLYFTHFPEGSVHPILVRRLIFRLAPQNAPALIRPIAKLLFTKLDEKINAPDLERQGKLIESHLEKTGGWFAGGEVPTAADFMMSFTVEVFLNRAPEYAGPKTREYVKKMQSRPAYKRAVERGGEYAFILH